MKKFCESLPSIRKLNNLFFESSLVFSQRLKTAFISRKGRKEKLTDNVGKEIKFFQAEGCKTLGAFLSVAVCIEIRDKRDPYDNMLRRVLPCRAHFIDKPGEVFKHQRIAFAGIFPINLGI